MRLRYTLTEEQMQAEVAKVHTLFPQFERVEWDGTVILSAPPSYRLTFNTGGLTAKRSKRSNKWAIIHGIG
jgi:hypothetical protein